MVGGGRPIHVLVIDDSAVVRTTIERRLSSARDWRVTVAADGVTALDRVRSDPPDVILLDLDMPRLDGLTFLRHLMATAPIPTVVCSGFAPHGSEAARAALEAGAVDLFPKPSLGVKSFLEGAGPSLATVLREAATSASSLRKGWRSQRVEHHRQDSGAAPTPRPDHPLPVRTDGTAERATDGRGVARHPCAVLIGASMGGPKAIRRLLADFPANAPPCLIVQHMPDGATAPFARRLDQAVAVHVREAADGDVLRRGHVLIAPGDRQLSLSGSPGPVVRVHDGTPLNGHRPSVDVLFRSAAGVLGASAVGVLLTGMGRDGAEGLLALREAGARTIAQDRAECAAPGMPDAAIALGAAERVVPLEALGATILEMAETLVRGVER